MVKVQLVQASCRMPCQAVEGKKKCQRLQGSNYLHQREVCCVLELCQPQEEALKYRRAERRLADLLPREVKNFSEYCLSL